MKSSQLVDIPGAYCFIVEGPPAPKPVGPQKPKAPGVLNYQAYRQIIGLRANSVFREPLRGPAAIGCIWHLPIPESWPELDKRDARRDRRAHIVKPDTKNLLASVEDSLTGIAWLDDAQVCGYLPMLKRYTDLQYTRTFVTVLDLAVVDASEKFGALFAIGQDLDYSLVVHRAPGQD